MKKHLKSINYYFANSKNKLKVFSITLVVILILLFLCFIYSDILITTKHSINLWKTIFNGKPFDFYAINYGVVIDHLLPAETTVCYEFPIFIFFALWNFPLWIIQKVFNIEVTTSFLCLIWIKLILVVLLGLCLKVIKKICLEIKISKDHIPLVLLTFVSSPLLIIPLFIMAQYDILAILFMLLGILMYIRDNNKKFILYFAIAIILKMFALFIFIPLILLKNKKIMSIINNLLFGVGPLSVIKFVSTLLMPMYNESMSGFSDNMLSKLFNKGLNVNFGNASLFCVSLIAVAIFCYMKNIKTKEELYKFSIYIPLLIFTCFFIFVDFHPYWIVLLTPFMAIAFFQNAKNFKINIILDIIASTSILIMTSIVYYWCYGPLVVERMLLPKIFGSTYNEVNNYQYMSDLLVKFNIDKIIPFLLAAFATCMAGILIINFPREKNTEKDNLDFEWGLLFFRMLIVIPFAILIIFCYYSIK